MITLYQAYRRKRGDQEFKTWFRPKAKARAMAYCDKLNAQGKGLHLFECRPVLVEEITMTAFSDITQLGINTVMRWIEEGIIYEPDRNVNGHRLFTQVHIDCVRRYRQMELSKQWQGR